MIGSLFVEFRDRLREATNPPHMPTQCRLPKTLVTNIDRSSSL